MQVIAMKQLCMVRNQTIMNGHTVTIGLRRTPITKQLMPFLSVEMPYLRVKAKNTQHTKDFQSALLEIWNKQLKFYKYGKNIYA
jgi:hypothetical protein